jgi:prophage maintenance system killer protein
MEIWIRELEKINKTFEPNSKIKNAGSLEFAAEHAARTADWMKKLAYLLRAIVVDHAFEDGNKRTAVYLVFKFFEENHLPIDQQKADRLIIKIASENITDINKIKRLIHDETL